MPRTPLDRREAYRAAYDAARAAGLRMSRKEFADFVRKLPKLFRRELYQDAKAWLEYNDLNRSSRPPR